MESLNKMDEFYKSMMEQGYKLSEVNKMTMTEVNQLNRIYEEKETTIDKAFPFLFA